MKTFITRMRLLYLPFLLAAVLFIVIYTFLDWLLLLRLHVPLNEELIQYWLPALLPWGIIFVWLGPKLKLLAIKDKKDNMPFLYRFVLWVAIACPTVFAQMYVSTATSGLTLLNNINQLDSNHHSRYYTFSHYFIDTAHCVFYQTASTSGRSNENLTFYTYCACPILKDGNTLLITKAFAWLGFKFSKTISNNYSESYKKQVYKDFQAEWAGEFKKKDLQNFTYFDWIGHNNNRLGYAKAIEQADTGEPNPMILEGADKPFGDRNGNSLLIALISFGIGAVLWFLMIIIPRLKMGEVKKLEHPGLMPATDDKLKFWLNVVKNSCSAWLIIINIVVYLIMVFAGLGVESFDSDDLIKWGASYGPLTSHDQWWRLLTSTFVHSGLMHILTNMVSLVFAGFLLEPVIGKIKYLSAYIICGVLASIVSLFYHPHSVSVGASGAIMGLFGLALILVLTKPSSEALDKTRLKIALFLIGLNLLYGLAGNIDNAAHIGGLVCGMLLAILFRQFGTITLMPLKHTDKKRSGKTAGVGPSKAPGTNIVNN